MQQILLQLQSAQKFKVKDLLCYDQSIHCNTITQFDNDIYSYFEAAIVTFLFCINVFYIVNDRIVELQNYVNPL